MFDNVSYMAPNYMFEVIHVSERLSTVELLLVKLVSEFHLSKLNCEF